jgi:hypothetical protein
MQIEVVKEFSIYLADRPGELAGVLEGLTSAGAQVTAISVTEHNGRGLVRLVGEPVEAVRRVIEGVVDTGAGPAAEADVVAFPLEGGHGRFREIAVRLADSAINVRYAYQAPANNGTPSRCILRVEDPERAAEIIRDVI